MTTIITADVLSPAFIEQLNANFVAMDNALDGVLFEDVDGDLSITRDLDIGRDLLVSGDVRTNGLRAQATNDGAIVYPGWFVNSAGSANSSVGISLDPGANGPNVRDALIRATNNGSNVITLDFLVANGAPPATVLSIEPELVTLSQAMSYGGVTLSNAVSGTGSMVLSASPTFTGTAAFAALTTSGTLAAGGDVTINRSLGTLPSATDTVPYRFSASGSGHANGDSDLRGTRELTTVTGTNNIAKHYGKYLGLHNQMTAGTVILMDGQHSYLWLENAGVATTANVHFAHFRVDGAGGITTGSVFKAGNLTMSAGSGVIATLNGLNVDLLGHATRVTNARGVVIADMSAATSVVGVLSNVAAGSGKHAFRAAGGAPSSFESTNVGGASYPLYLSNLGTALNNEVVLSLTPSGTTARACEIAAVNTSAGSHVIDLVFRVVNGSSPGEAMRLKANQAAEFVSSVKATFFNVGGNQVVGARNTGWTAMTGTPDESTAYATGSVTLPQLAGRVMALQAALTTHGLIGA